MIFCHFGDKARKLTHKGGIKLYISETAKFLGPKIVPATIGCQQLGTKLLLSTISPLSIHFVIIDNYDNLLSRA